MLLILRKSGRFDAEIEVTSPNEYERLQILMLYTGKLPLDPGTDLQEIAASCNGYVGANLEALCREAAISAVQRSKAIVENDDTWCITMDDWKLARSIVSPSITRGVTVTVETPKVSWDDVGGLYDLKKKLRQAVEWPIKHAGAFSRMGVSSLRGIVLQGLPGCSKTTLAKAAAHAAQASFFSWRSSSQMGCGVSSGGGQSSFGYLFGSGEAPNPAATRAPANVSSEPAVKEAAKPAAAASNPQPTDLKKVPAGVNSNINNYHRADGQNTGNFIMDRPSTKAHAAPGGGSSLGYLFGGGSNQ